MPKKPGAIDIYDKNPWMKTGDFSTTFPKQAPDQWNEWLNPSDASSWDPSGASPKNTGFGGHRRDSGSPEWWERAYHVPRPTSKAPMGGPAGSDKTQGQNPFGGGFSPGRMDWLRNLMTSLRQNPGQNTGMFGGQWGGGSSDTGWGTSNEPQQQPQPFGGSQWGQFGHMGGPASAGYWQQRDPSINDQYRNYWDRNKSGANPTPVTTPKQVWQK